MERILLAAALVAASTQIIASDADDACGSKLCLMGQIIPTECGGYISKYLRKPTPPAKRRYLNKCKSGNDGFDDLIVDAALQCQPERLSAELNRRASSFAIGDGSHFSSDDPIEIPALCHRWYDHEWTRIDPPTQEEYNCRIFVNGADWGPYADGDLDRYFGHTARVCDMRWVAPPIPTAAEIEAETRADVAKFLDGLK